MPFVEMNDKTLSLVENNNKIVSLIKITNNSIFVCCCFVFVCFVVACSSDSYYLMSARRGWCGTRK